MKLILLLSIFGISSSQTITTSTIDVGTGVNLSHKLTGNILKVTAANSKSYLAFGFGASMNNGDIFMIEIKNSALSFSSCKLIGRQPLVCPANKWTFKESKLNLDGSWRVVVTRDITQNENFNIDPDTNIKIYTHSDLDELVYHPVGSL